MIVTFNLAFWKCPHFGGFTHHKTKDETYRELKHTQITRHMNERFSYLLLLMSERDFIPSSTKRCNILFFFPPGKGIERYKLPSNTIGYFI